MNTPHLSKTHPLSTAFCGAAKGNWQISAMHTLIGPSLPQVPCLEIVKPDALAQGPAPAWALYGLPSHLRYTTQAEKVVLDQHPSLLNKPENSCAVLIPIQKTAVWWQMAQDERRHIFEEDSQHIAFSQQYLSVISRKLYHAKDLGEDFDFLTWFEFAPENEGLFNELLDYLRSTREWKYVCREIDIRLFRSEASGLLPEVHYE
ncbi:MAG: chlorite dismutase [Microscillaceae bacterium]|nr:chlorite dismutase [Microscillaceae bacterium]